MGPVRPSGLRPRDARARKPRPRQPREEDAMVEEAGEARAVVFVADRSGPALRRRERCLKLAGIPHTVAVERRPSGTYYKLSVRERARTLWDELRLLGGCLVDLVRRVTPRLLPAPRRA